MRLHLFELEDQPWFPRVVRDAGTAYLGFASRVARQHEAIAPLLSRALRSSGERRIVDLCSGASGPVPASLAHLAEHESLEATATLTDLYPNREALERLTREDHRIDFRASPVDATDVPEDLPGLRTLFSGFHHFRPADAQRILADAARSGRPILAAELVARHPIAILGIFFAPVMTLLAVPFLRPVRLAWIPLTYLIPIIPLFIFWDGFVSCLRCYTVDELRRMTDAIAVPGYRFEVGALEVTTQPFDGTYVLGLPESG